MFLTRKTSLISVAFLLITQFLVSLDFQEAVKLFEKGDYDRSEQLFLDLLKEKMKIPESAYYLGTIYLIKNDLKKSREFLTKAVDMEKENSKYNHRLGQAYGQLALQVGLLKKFKMAKRAKKYFIKAVELDGENIAARWDLFNYYLMAPPIAGGDDDQAIIQAAAIKKINPERGHEAVFLIYKDQRDYTKAENELFKILELSNHKRKIYMWIGFFYQESKQFAKAKAVFLKIYNEVNPRDHDALYQLGRTIFFSGKDLLEGIKYFEEYLTTTPKKSSPTFSDTHWRIGKIYEKINQNKKAITHYQMALKLDPQHQPAKKSLRKIK